MTHGISARDQKLLDEIRRAAKSPKAVDPRADKIARGSLSADRACAGKVKYRTPKFASVIAEVVEKRFGNKMHMYFCPFCECYHLATERAA